MTTHRAAALASLLLLAACGSQPGSPRATDDHAQRLLAAADTAAAANAGTARRVEAVRVQRSRAEVALFGARSSGPDDQVWVVQVSGDDYSCGGCSRPVGAAAATGRYLTLVLRTSDYESSDFGVGPERKDLSGLGAVEVLRDR